jgi:hypothetical protein
VARSPSAWRRRSCWPTRPEEVLRRCSPGRARRPPRCCDDLGEPRNRRSGARALRELMLRFALLLRGSRRWSRRTSTPSGGRQAAAWCSTCDCESSTAAQSSASRRGDERDRRRSPAEDAARKLLRETIQYPSGYRENARNQRKHVTSVVITSAARTAIGSFGRSLRDVPPTELGATVKRPSLTSAGTSCAI